MGTRFIFVRGIVFFFLVILFSVCKGQSALDVIQRSEEKARGVKSSIMEVSIKTIRKNWTREMDIKIWSKGQDYSLILINSPLRDKGTAFLKIKKEVWNWIPSIERTIKMPPSMMTQSWMGTDFSNDDLVKESSLVKDYTHKMLKDSTINGSVCYKIELTPKENAAVVWGKMIVFIDKKHEVQTRSEMYDEDLYLVNVMNSSNIKMMDGRMIPTINTLMPVDKNTQKTIMEIKSIYFDREIAQDFFTTQNMRKVQ